MDKRSFHKVINDFLFGSHELSELDLEFQIALEEKIDNLKDGEHLYWYCDYDSKGNLYDFYKTFARINEFGRISYPWCGPYNKSGIRIKNEKGILKAEIKRGYGKNWETYTCKIN